MRLVVLVAALGACTDSYDHVKVAPRVCAFGNADLAFRRFETAPQEFQAGERLNFAFFAPADGCPPNIVGWCDVAIGLDDTLHVSAQIAWNGESPELCPRVIHGAGATCETLIPLAARTYRIVFGGAETPIAIPSTTDQAVCVERQPD